MKCIYFDRYAKEPICHQECGKCIYWAEETTADKILNMDNDDLLQELIYAYNDMEDYTFVRDNIKWSDENEQKAVKKYMDLKEEAIRRMQK